MEQQSILAFLSKSSKNVEDESGSESGGECPERPGNSVSGVVGRSLGSGVVGSSLGRGHWNLKRFLYFSSSRF